MRIVYSLLNTRTARSYRDVFGIPPLVSEAASKAELFRARHTLLLQRTARHDLFSPSTAAASTNNASSSERKKFRLKTVEFLLGSSSVAKGDDVIVLGMLTQVRHGKYSLEDPTGAVPLDLSEAKFHTGLYTENCFVLVEGWLVSRDTERTKTIMKYMEFNMGG